eukprot:3151082-Prymnesium_polylepis.1
MPELYQTKRPGAPMPGLYQTPRGTDARGVAGHDAPEVEVDSDGEVDARYDLVVETDDRRDAALGD